MTANRQGIMLGYAFTKKLFERLGSPLIVQPKLEGDRLRSPITEGIPVLLSSSAAVRHSLPHIEDELRKSKFNTIELDGEAYVHGWKHSQIRSIVSRTVNLHPNHKAMQYHVYDIVSGDDQLDRLARLWDILKSREWSYIKPVPFNMVRTLDEVQKLYDYWLAAGYEGIIMRSMYAPYVRKKTVTMLKFKPRLSEYFEILNVIEEVSIKGVQKDTFGAFTCITEDGSQTFSVGSGPTKEQRDKLWENRELLVGSDVKIRFQGYTHARSVPKMQSIDKEWLENMMKSLP